MPGDSGDVRVACFATQGSGSGDERRIVELLGPLEPELWRFDRSRRRASALAIARMAIRRRPDVVVVEGTGLAGGIPLMLVRLLSGVPYIVSSGDAVGPFFAAHSRGAGLVGGAYERALCRLSAGYVAWTPYLAGRALSFGAPRAMTAAGWGVPGDHTAARERLRAQLGIEPGALVFGIVGSINWSERRGYCYGLELVRAAAKVSRPDVHVLVVGDGDGMARLRREAESSGVPVHLPGRVAADEVPGYLAAMDVASLPQSVDRLGAFRYSTKLPEYLAAGLPVVTGELPLAYDLDDGWLWRLPGEAPWEPAYVSALAALMASVTAGEVAERRSRVPRELDAFDLESQRRRTVAFVREAALAARARRGAG